MAVVVKYVVERNGVERMTFTTKKEADAYDKPKYQAGFPIKWLSSLMR